MKVLVCLSCDLGQHGFAGALQAALNDAKLAAIVEGIDCMSGCTRASTIAFRDSGKTAYLFGDLTEADLPDLLTFARLYRQSSDGNLSDARLIGRLRSKAIARIPA